LQSYCGCKIATVVKMPACQKLLLLQSYYCYQFFTTLKLSCSCKVLTT
jgi:hypothetical protein